MKEDSREANAPAGRCGRVMVSACLFGERVRYDGGDQTCRDDRFLKWKKAGLLMPFCPEVFGGLPVPRPAAERVGDCIRTRSGQDVTTAFAAGAAEALRLARSHGVVCAIFKEGSPSCGRHAIHDGTFTGSRTSGMGLAAEALLAAGIPVFCEHELDAAERFLTEAAEKGRGGPFR